MSNDYMKERMSPASWAQPGNLVQFAAPSWPLRFWVYTDELQAEEGLKSST